MSVMRDSAMARRFFKDADSASVEAARSSLLWA
jgi:hypothetical protein